MPLSHWETTSEPFSTTEPTEITERGADGCQGSLEEDLNCYKFFKEKSRIDVL
jgi:hypothetical protein